MPTTQRSAVLSSSATSEIPLSSATAAIHIRTKVSGAAIWKVPERSLIRTKPPIATRHGRVVRLALPISPQRRKPSGWHRSPARRPTPPRAQPRLRIERRRSHFARLRASIRAPGCRFRGALLGSLAGWPPPTNSSLSRRSRWQSAQLAPLPTSSNDGVGLASASALILIQHSACAVIERHVTALASQACSYSSSSDDASFYEWIRRGDRSP